jgi:hypothetical protein
MSPDQPGASDGAQPGAASAPRYRRPTQAPDDVAFDNLNRWARLTAASAATATSTAQTWRNGLAGFVTLLMSVLILQGSDVADLGSPWRYVVTAAIGLGAVASVVGLWLALRAEAPPLMSRALDRVIADHGSVAAYERSVQTASARSLAWAKGWVMTALVAILAGTMTWWLAPVNDAGPDAKAFVSARWIDGNTTMSACGASLPAPDGELQLQIEGADTPVRVQLTSVQSVRAVAAC